MMHRSNPADSYPSAGINRIRFIGLMQCSISQPRFGGTPLSERENAICDRAMSRVGYII